VGTLFVDWGGNVSIEWYISDATPVRTVDIVQNAEVISRTLGCGKFDFTATRQRAENVAPTGINGEFTWEVSIYTPTAPTMVILNAGRMIDDAGGEPCSELIFGSVLAGRTRISAVLGIITALSWFEIAGGTLSGTGLVRHRERSEFDSIVHFLLPPSGVDLDVSVQHISRLLLGSSTEFPLV
jgi:hypothetical protein